MAMLFDLDAERDARFRDQRGSVADDPRQAIDATFSELASQLNDLGGSDTRAALRRVRRYRSRLLAIQDRLVASMIRDDGDDRSAKRALNDGMTTKAAINRSAQRAAVTKANKDLAAKAESGELSEEQLDVIADASTRTDGAAATDNDFIDKVAGVDPDQGKVIADEFVAAKTTPGGTDTEHKRQRALRRGSKYYAKKRGLNAICFEGDGPATKEMWAQIEKRANELYEADGGSDIAVGQHPRTRAQLLFDAAHEIICNVTTTPTGVSRRPRYGDGTGTPSRPQIFVGITLDHYLGLDPAARATQIGLGQIPDSVLAEYLEHADIMGVLYDCNGQPLWLGRAKRHASIMQRYALILRDKHCVMCGADHTKCDAHHCMPWNAPGKGLTDLDQMVLLCRSCHLQLHADNYTIYLDAKQQWRTRPATPDEIPVQRPADTRNPPRRE